MRSVLALVHGFELFKPLALDYGNEYYSNRAH